MVLCVPAESTCNLVYQMVSVKLKTNENEIAELPIITPKHYSECVLVSPI